MLTGGFEVTKRVQGHTSHLIKHTFKYILVHSGGGNDIISDQANSQLIVMIIPKEALAGLLTTRI